MSCFFPWSDSIKKRACRYLLQHYLGHFLQEKLTLEQLSVDLYEGTGTVKDVPLDVWALNEILENVGAPFEIIDGYIGSISVSVPWTALLKDNCRLELHGLELTFQPKQRTDTSALSMTESMLFATMTTSMELAQECMKQDTSSGEEQAEASQPYKGLESFAQTIESVLARIELCCVDAVFRLEYLPKDSKTGVGLEINIKRIDYSDLSSQVPDDGQFKSKSVYEPAAFAFKNLRITGLTVSMDEFPESARTIHRYPSTGSPDSPPPSPNSATSSPPITPYQSALFNHPITVSPPENLHCLPPITVASSAGKQEIRLKWKQNMAVPGPKLELEYFLGTLNVFLSPKQVHLLTELANGVELSQDPPSHADMKSLKCKPMGTEDYQKIENDLHQQLVTKRQEFQYQRQQRVDSWVGSDNRNLTGSQLSSSTADTDYDSIIGDDGEERFYSMSPHENFLPPLEDPPVLVPLESTNSSKKPDFQNNSLAGFESKPGSCLPARASSVFKPPSILGGTSPEVFTGSKTSPLGTGKQSNSLKTFPAVNTGLAGISSLDDPSSDILKMKIKLSSLSVTILHEDPVITPGSKARDKVNDYSESDHPLCSMAESFFKELGTIGFGCKDFENVKERFTNACPYDHLRFLSAPLTLEFEKSSSHSYQVLSAEVTVGVMELTEFLFKRSSNGSSCYMSPCAITKLLKFSEKDDVESKFLDLSSLGTSHCFKSKYKSTQRTISPGGIQPRNTLLPRNEITVELGKLQSEIDISIVDRLTALLHPQPLFQRHDGTPTHSRVLRTSNQTMSMNQQAFFNQAMDEGPLLSDQRTSVQVTCPTLVLNLRFPIPDLRAPSDIDISPWWKQNLRKESLLLEFNSVEFKTTLSGSVLTTADITFKDALGHFITSPDVPPVPFLKVSYGQCDSETGSVPAFDWPRIVFSVSPPAQFSLLEEVESEDVSPVSSLEDGYSFTKAEPSPFSSKPVMYESEKLVIPGDPKEMGEFQDKATASSKIQLEFTLPHVDINLHDKEFYELIYNRLAGDLLLWEPNAPTPKDTSDNYTSYMAGVHLDLASQLMDKGLGSDRFLMCRSGFNNYDSSSSDDEDDMSNNHLLDHKHRKHNYFSNQQSFMALSINVTKARIALFPPSMESPETKDRSEDDEDACDQAVLGELLLDLDDIQLFLVASYKGQSDVSYMSLQAARGSMYHAEIVESNTHLDMSKPFTCPDLKATLYKSEKGVCSRLSRCRGDARALAVAMKVNTDPVKKIKEFTLALGIQGSTIQYRVVPEGQAWIAQMIQFLDVKEEQILGFVPPAVVTIFHAHLWGCSVDYRPLYLPLRVLLTTEAFTVSSNITIESSVSLLRFIIDDAALYLSTNLTGPVDLRKNYVCVLDLGLFELSLKTSDGKDTRFPKLDLSMSNNTLHIWTCSDSCAALVQLIQYFAEDGDLNPPCTSQLDTTHDMSADTLATSPPTYSPMPLPPYKQTSVEEDMINSLMSDAMDETFSPFSSPKKGSKTDLSRNSGSRPDLFLFPDEANRPVDSSEKNIEDIIGQELDEKQEQSDENQDEDKDDEDEEDDDEDDEFCILDHPEKEPESALDEPTISYLIDEEIHVKENHFTIPIGKTDQLRAPDHYPAAVNRYTLREMSLVWHMFGGQDFGTSSCNQTKQTTINTAKRINFSVNDGMKNGSKSPRKQASSQASHKQDSTNSSHVKNSWRTRGGQCRDIDVQMELQMNKIRYQFEQYPKDTQQASRQVLLIQDVEIRDRLVSSKINKFLYRYTSEAMPKQTHANMVMFKMLLMRPDEGLDDQECCLRVALQPLRLNVDQDALFFLKGYFNEVTEEVVKGGVKATASGETVSQLTLIPGTESSPPMFYPSFDEPASLPSTHPASLSYSSSASDEKPSDGSSPVFFRTFLFAPEVPIRLDYQGKHVDMDQGTLAGILIGLAQLNCSELTLKRLCYRNGLLGVDKLVNYALNEWVTDIRRSQIPRILGGVGPVHSLVQLVQGLVDLVWLPIEQYRRDGRVVRGLQRGANSFSTSTAMAFLELTNRLVQTVQTAAVTVHDMVSPGPSVARQSSQGTLPQQPADMREGFSNAYNVVAEGISRTASNIVQIARNEHDQKGITGAVGGVLRNIPPTVVQPIILATEATSNVIDGVRNQILPDVRREAAEKWRTELDTQR